MQTGNCPRLLFFCFRNLFLCASIMNMINVHVRSWLVALAFYDTFLAGSVAFCADYNFENDTVIAPNTSYSNEDTIFITRSLTIENHGYVYGLLKVGDGCNVRIENTNVFNASMDLGTNASVSQIIRTDSDITTLGINVPYNVLITESDSVLNWNNVLNNTTNATRYNLENARLHMDNFVSANNVNIAGRIMVYTDTMPSTDVALFTNLSGTGMVTVMSSDLDALYLVEPYMVGGDMYVRAARSYDYARMLKNNTGEFLNRLRDTEPNDSLLAQLDSANTMDEFNQIMNKSVKLHPIKMMQSLKTMYSHKMLETMHIAQNDGIGVVPMVMFSNDMFVMGIEPYLNLNLLDDLHVKVSANLSSLKYSNDINSYRAMSYGVGADVIYDLPHNNFARAYGGLNLSSFDAGLVFDGNSATEKPRGMSGYLVGEFGHRFDFKSNYYVSPFVMMGGDYASILNHHDVDGYVGLGSDVGFNFEFDSFRYDYVARGLLRSNGGVGGELNISIWSIVDSAGAGLRGGIFYDDTVGTSYHVALDAKFNF